MEPEFLGVLPPGVTLHTTRIPYLGDDSDGVAKMNSETISAALLLKDVAPNVIVYGCTTGTMVEGAAWEAELKKSIEEATSIPTITTSRSIVEAFEALGASKLAVFSPYGAVVNDDIARFLRAAGFEITNILSMHWRSPFRNLSEAEIETAAGKLDASGADGVFMACTGLKTITFIDRLSATYRKPAVSSNTATFWATLNHLDPPVSIGAMPGCANLGPGRP
jgi:maleate isomerase